MEVIRSKYYIFIFFGLFCSCSNVPLEECCSVLNYKVKGEEVNDFMCHLKDLGTSLGTGQKEVLSFYNNATIIKDISYSDSDPDTISCKKDRFFSITSNIISNGQEVRIIEQLSFCSGFLRYYTASHRVVTNINFDEIKEVFRYSDECKWNRALADLKISETKNVDKENFESSIALVRMKSNGENIGWELIIAYEIKRE